MMKLRHTTLVFLSGIVWFAVGVFLLQLGLNLLVGVAQYDPAMGDKSYPMMDNLAPYLGGRNSTALVLIAVSLLIGNMKGKYVLGKSAKSGIERICAMSEPACLSKIYSPKYYILLGAMIGLGVLIKVFQLSSDIRGVVDTAIGAALLNGSLFYFRSAFALRKPATSSK